MRKSLTWLIYIITITMMVIFQTSFFPQFVILRVKPDLVLLFALSVGLLKGYREGAIVGAVAGVITGLISGNLWGIYVLVYSLAGFVAGLVPEKVEPDNIFIPLAVEIGGSVGAALVFALIGKTLNLFIPTTGDYYKALIFLGWNAFFSIPVFWLSRYLLVRPSAKMELEATGMGSDYLIE